MDYEYLLITDYFRRDGRVEVRRQTYKGNDTLISDEVLFVTMHISDGEEPADEYISAHMPHLEETVRVL